MLHLALAVNEDVAIHSLSVHVNMIVHVCHAAIGVLLGVHHVHVGTAFLTTNTQLVLVVIFVFHALSYADHESTHR